MTKMTEKSSISFSQILLVFHTFRFICFVNVQRNDTIIVAGHHFFLRRCIGQKIKSNSGFFISYLLLHRKTKTE